MKTIFILLCACFLAGCVKNANTDNRSKSIAEIAQTEKAFEKMALEKGVTEAFGFYAAPEAKIRYKDTILNGRDDIVRFYKTYKYQNIELRWTADFVDAAESGELGYTYGRYTFVGKDSSGNVANDKGYFHTVWKKQSDGTWKFVWD